ncbi:MAG: ATP-binding protein [Candidatus Falkowbacteria bacterium]|nr:ATP-binding protein [Candidatus Falkowbacteria bacterium]
MKKHYQKLIRRIYLGLIAPKNSNEDVRRKEFILNVLLIASEVLMAAILLLSFVREVIDLIDGKDRGFSPIVFLIMTAVFILAHCLSRLGKIKAASLIFLSIFLVPNLYLSYHWGIDLPQSLLLYAFTILASGTLINNRFSLAATAGISFYLATLGYLQGHGIVKPNIYWASEMATIYDAIPIVITLSIMATMSWLSNHEIENSLSRARKSEKSLALERDNLEITVEKRTNELQKMQMEKIGQLYRFAEFGRISSGIFHDLINPLTAISLNLEQLSKESRYQETSEKVEQAISAAKRMEILIIGVKKQLKKEDSRQQFSLNQEVKEVLSLLTYRANTSKVLIKFRHLEELEIFGDPLKFSQIILNLTANSIDALDGEIKDEKRISIKLGRKNDGKIFLTIKDNGSGIKPENIKKIFEPFFSTKEGKGLGLGLSSIKHLVEKDFGGTISVKNLPEGGCSFSVTLPSTVH